MIKMNISFQEGQRIFLNGQFATLRLASSTGSVSSYLEAIQAGLSSYKSWQVQFDNGYVETYTEVRLAEFHSAGQLTIVS